MLSETGNASPPNNEMEARGGGREPLILNLKTIQSQGH